MTETDHHHRGGSIAPEPRRRRRSSALAGAGIAALLACFALSWMIWDGLGLRIFGGLTRAEAVDEAASVGGLRWPGTSVSISQQGDRATVTRTWLGLEEARSSIVKRVDGWYDGGSPEYGPGEVVQGLVVVVLVPSSIGWAVARALRRSRVDE